MTRAFRFATAGVLLSVGLCAGVLIHDRVPQSWLDQTGSAAAPPERDQEQAPEIEPEDLAVEVTVAVATRGDVPQVVVGCGRMEALPAGQRTVASRAGGRVRPITIRAGQHVTRGDLLFALDGEPLASRSEELRAALAIATAALDAFDHGERAQRGAGLEAATRTAAANAALAEENAGRQGELADRGLVADSALLAARQAAADAQLAAELAANTALVWSESGADAARAALAGAVDAARAAFDEAQAMLDAATVVAPIDGTILAVLVDTGSIVDPGTPLATLQSGAERAIRFALTPSDARRVSADARVTFRGEGGLSGTGRVVADASAVSKISGMAEVIIDVEHSTSPALLGDLVRGEVEVGVLTDVCVVPEAAVVRADDELVVHVVDAEGLAHIVPIEVLGRAAGRCAVSGIEPGVQVVISGAYNLPDGARVVVR